MAESNADKIKFKILKGLDISGFAVFDPVVRLVFGEEPKKQAGRIFRYIAVPAAFVLLCIAFWSWIGPRHKTKSGEVPTPDVVWESARINSTIAKREKLKQSDFLLDGERRQETLTKVESQYAALTEKVDEARRSVSEAEKEGQGRKAAQIAPINAAYEALKDRFDAVQQERKAGLDELAERVSLGKAPAGDLVKALRLDDAATSKERDELKVLKSEMDAIRSERFAPLDAARKRFDALSDEALFLSTRIEFLSNRNLSVKKGEAKVEVAGYLESLEKADTGKSALSIAKRSIRAEDSLSRMEGQEYASAVTIYHQAKRSVFTVFCGFFMAAFVAIPVGIMCGLNRVFMACMMPIISIFKPVSPVVWLLIFQIVVGAFFPDPESHGLFRFFNSLPFIGELGVNPALVFSACTVAMCAVWPALVNTALGVSSIDKDHLNVARVLRLGFWSRLFKIVIPSALPLVFAGLRISLGVGWMVLIAAEALSSSDGLGKFVWDEYQNGSSLTFANIIMVCFVVGIIGFFLDRLMIFFQRLVSFDGAGATV